MPQPLLIFDAASNEICLYYSNDLEMASVEMIAAMRRSKQPLAVWTWIVPCPYCFRLHFEPNYSQRRLKLYCYYYFYLVSVHGRSGCSVHSVPPSIPRCYW
jgi:hypothetical protein